MRLEWDDVRLFLALVQTGSLTGAGKAMGLDTSTVSRRLAGMEESIGAALFVRSREGVRPTVAAEELLPDAQDAEQALARMTRIAEGLDVAPEGVVRLTVPPTIAETFVVPALPRLLAKYPKLRLEVLATTSIADLTRREADLAVRTSRPTSGDLVFVKLFSAPYALFASKSLVAKLGRLSTFTGVPFVTWTPDFAQLPSAQWVSRRVSSSDVVLKIGSMAGQLAAAAVGLGVALLPRPIGRASLVELAITPALREAVLALPSDDLWLVGHQALRRVPRVEAVWQFLLETATKNIKEFS